MKNTLFFLIISLHLISHAQVEGKKYKVGEIGQGGIIFWVDSTGEHGLVAAPSDQNEGKPIRWSAGKPICTLALGYWEFAGRGNTEIIIAIQGKGDLRPYAAQLCKELRITQNGVTYSDWYLPAGEELQLMKLQSKLIGGFQEAYYWSSTEYRNDNEESNNNDPNFHYAGEVSFYYHDNHYYQPYVEIDKDTKRNVRAIRFF